MEPYRCHYSHQSIQSHTPIVPPFGYLTSQASATSLPHAKLHVHVEASDPTTSPLSSLLKPIKTSAELAISS